MFPNMWADLLDLGIFFLRGTVLLVYFSENTQTFKKSSAARKTDILITNIQTLMVFSYAGNK